ncbi:thiamine-phosphate kinase [Gemmatimonas groenlandica]|uniref:Thiamine-monophosphate kinase n=1 Tax=Gemmatimonas groenlandica TaxID=2732249 RepID=A0A6M4ILA3_9BACT|nr:thiamine-phosphate kinase [Gemmatimonas groenlandica]QJR35430.1 thiamine-phosphate kinase [Gemmatimonas groenlandica]
MSLEPRPHQAMREGAEFDTIRALMARWGDLAVDIGDDAAVLAPSPHGTRVVSVDACVEDVHFRRAWISAREVGVRAAVAALSDLAAMGARAEYVLIAFVIPDAWREELSEVADGMGAVIREAGARIVGGNLSQGAVFSITTTVVGCAQRAVSRSGARAGDLVVVTGLLGGPGAAIQAWDAGESPTAWSRGRFAAPAPRWAEGEALALAGASAMIDISDGLAGDARHVAAASGVRLDLDASRVPAGPGIAAAVAMQSGEEYELLACIPEEAYKKLAMDWAAISIGPLTVVGVVRDGADASPTSTASPVAGGFDHFASVEIPR